jgi:uncharacterized Zn-binding protein involved in type VI secretion
MPAVARELDLVTTNHLCDGSTVTEEHSPNVSVNYLRIHRVGDKQQSHTYPSGDSCPLHQLTLDAYGSTAMPPNVFVNGKAIGRLGDTYGTEVISSASLNVFANG